MNSLQGTSWTGSYRVTTDGRSAEVWFNGDSALGTGPVALDNVAAQVSWHQVPNGNWAASTVIPVVDGRCRLVDKYGNMVGEAEGSPGGLRLTAYGRQIFLSADQFRKAFEAASPWPHGLRELRFDFGSPALPYTLRLVVSDPDPGKLPSPGLVFAFAAITFTVR